MLFNPLTPLRGEADGKGRWISLLIQRGRGGGGGGEHKDDYKTFPERLAAFGIPGILEFHDSFFPCGILRWSDSFLLVGILKPPDFSKT